jgi:hypothetical protein
MKIKVNSRQKFNQKLLSCVWATQVARASDFPRLNDGVAKEGADLLHFFFCKGYDVD